MKVQIFRYLVILPFLLIVLSARSQNNNSESSVTIIGDPVIIENNGNVISNNQQSGPPPAPMQQLAPRQDNIEPNLENGFHMRFQVENTSVEKVNSLNSSSFSSSGGGAKAKKRTISMTQRSFNFKKKLKNWLPELKKKYHPTLCEKFR